MKFIYHLFRFFYWISNSNFLIPVSQHQPYRTIRLTPVDAGILLEVTTKKLPFPWFHPLLSPVRCPPRRSRGPFKQTRRSVSPQICERMRSMRKAVVGYPSRILDGDHHDSRQEQRDPRTNRVKFTAAHRGSRVHVGKSVVAPPTFTIVASYLPSVVKFWTSKGWGKRIEIPRIFFAFFFLENMKHLWKLICVWRVQEWMRHK